jgi:hypothetical protein
MRFFSLEGSIPAVLRDDGAAFILKSDGAWGEISAKELLADTRTPELTAAEFDARMAVFGGDLSTLPTPETPPLTIRSPELQFDYETPASEAIKQLIQERRERITHTQRRQLEWILEELELGPPDKRDWELIEVARDFFAPRDGNAKRAGRTDLEQTRVVLLAARKMTSDDITKTAVHALMLEAGICRALNPEEIGDETLKSWLDGKPRGRKPEDYIADEQGVLGCLFPLDEAIAMWEVFAGVPITKGLPDGW